MTHKRQDRAPLRAHGQAANASVPLYFSSHDPELSAHEVVLYRLAAVTEYEQGEPEELTRARDLVDSWCDFALLGLPLIPPRAVATAMKLRGYKSCE